MGVQQYEDLSKDVKKLFKLDTKNTSYVIAVVDDEQFLGHVYYGQTLNDYHLDHLLLSLIHIYICEGTSKANSGIAHAGYDAKSGTLKAKLNVAGSRMIRQLSKELDFAYEQNGSLVLCFDEKNRDKLEALFHRGEQNGVEDLRIVAVSYTHLDVYKRQTGSIL